MQKIPYTIKTTANKELMIKKESLGAYYFELQLLDEFTKEKNMQPKDIIKKLELNNCEILTVHTPISYEDYIYSCINLHCLTDFKVKDDFKKTCELANLISIKQNRMVKVILHNSVSLKELKVMPKLYSEIKNLLKEMIETYPNIIIEVENVVPIEIVPNIKYPLFMSGGFSENCDIVKDIRRELKYPERLKTVLDICHLIQSARICKAITGQEISFIKVMEEYIDTLGTIHFSNCKNLGIQADEHGVIFDENDPNDKGIMLNLLLDLEEVALKHKNFPKWYGANFNILNDYDLCLEVLENDYATFDNARKMAKMLKNI